MSAAAPPPTALKSDTSCGIAVIFTVRAVYMPRPPTTAMPRMMISQPIALKLWPGCVWPTSRRTAVAAIARAMPPADTRLPFRAVAGEFIRIRPRTKAAAPASQTSRTMLLRVVTSIASALVRVGLRRGRRRLLAEHLEHPVRDDVAADHVHRREGDRDEGEQLADRCSRLDGDEHRADQDDAVDRVGAGHQRGVERCRDLADDGEAAEDREDEDRQGRDQGVGVAHALPPLAGAAGARWRSFRTGSATTSPSRVMTVDFVTSSSKSRLSSPSLTIPSRSAEMFRAKNADAPAGIVAGRLSGAMTVTPLSVTTVSPALDSSQFPPSADAAMSTITEPGFICRTPSAVTRTGGFRPGTWAVVMTTSMPPITSLSS